MIHYSRVMSCFVAYHNNNKKRTEAISIMLSSTTEEKIYNQQILPGHNIATYIYTIL
jgi:hypothetical protein